MPAHKKAARPATAAARMQDRGGKTSEKEADNTTEKAEKADQETNKSLRTQDTVGHFLGESNGLEENLGPFSRTVMRERGAEMQPGLKLNLCHLKSHRRGKSPTERPLTPEIKRLLRKAASEATMLTQGNSPHVRQREASPKAAWAEEGDHDSERSQDVSFNLSPDDADLVAEDLEPSPQSKQHSQKQALNGVLRDVKSRPATAIVPTLAHQKLAEVETRTIRPLSAQTPLARLKASKSEKTFQKVIKITDAGGGGLQRQMSCSVVNGETNNDHAEIVEQADRLNKIVNETETFVKDIYARMAGFNPLEKKSSSTLLPRASSAGAMPGRKGSMKKQDGVTHTKSTASAIPKDRSGVSLLPKDPAVGADGEEEDVWRDPKTGEPIPKLELKTLAPANFEEQLRPLVNIVARNRQHCEIVKNHPQYRKILKYDFFMGHKAKIREAINRAEAMAAEREAKIIGEYAVKMEKALLADQRKKDALNRPKSRSASPRLLEGADRPVTAPSGPSSAIGRLSMMKGGALKKQLTFAHPGSMDAASGATANGRGAVGVASSAPGKADLARAGTGSSNIFSPNAKKNALIRTAKSICITGTGGGSLNDLFSGDAGPTSIAPTKSRGGKRRTVITRDGDLKLNLEDDEDSVVGSWVRLLTHIKFMAWIVQRKKDLGAIDKVPKKVREKIEFQAIRYIAQIRLRKRIAQRRNSCIIIFQCLQQWQGWKLMWFCCHYRNVAMRIQAWWRNCRKWLQSGVSRFKQKWIKAEKRMCYLMLRARDEVDKKRQGVAYSPPSMTYEERIQVMLVAPAIRTMIIENELTYKRWYHVAHENKDLLKEYQQQRANYYSEQRAAKFMGIEKGGKSNVKAPTRPLMRSYHPNESEVEALIKKISQLAMQGKRDKASLFAVFSSRKRITDEVAEIIASKKMPEAGDLVIRNCNDIFDRGVHQYISNVKVVERMPIQKDEIDAPVVREPGMKELNNTVNIFLQDNKRKDDFDVMEAYSIHEH